MQKTPTAQRHWLGISYAPEYSEGYRTCAGHIDQDGHGGGAGHDGCARCTGGASTGAVGC